MAEEKNVQSKSIKAKKDNGGASRFFKETMAELKKVVWPTRKQLAINTFVVIIASILVALFIWGIDNLFLYAERIILNK